MLSHFRSRYSKPSTHKKSKVKFFDAEVGIGVSFLRFIRPLLSFVLFTGTFSSPALCVLTDVSTIDNDIRAFASRYLSNTVKADL